MAAVWLWTGVRSRRLLLLSFQCLVVMDLLPACQMGQDCFGCWTVGEKCQ